MSKSLRWTGLAFFGAVLVAYGARGDDAPKVSGDLKKMQGTWVNAAEGEAELRWVFNGTTVKSTVNGVEYTSTITVAEKAEPLPTIDFAVTDGPEEFKGKKTLGIYKIDGDKLTICVAMPDTGKRPSELKAVQDEAFLFELKRDKDK